LEVPMEGSFNRKGISPGEEADKKLCGLLTRSGSYGEENILLLLLGIEPKLLSAANKILIRNNNTRMLFSTVFFYLNFNQQSEFTFYKLML
jgi:hypothetical protein